MNPLSCGGTPYHFLYSQLTAFISGPVIGELTNEGVTVSTETTAKPNQRSETPPPTYDQVNKYDGYKRMTSRDQNYKTISVIIELL